MLIIPAIDLLGQKVVRLQQGREETAKIYSDDPVQFALKYQEAGAKWIHVVDLDGAFGRSGINDALIIELAETLSIPFELGGGIHTMDQIGYWLNRGVSRVVLGSIAVREPDIVEKAIRKYGNKAIVAGIDVRDRQVMISGWTEGAGVEAMDLAKKMKIAGLARIIVTDIRTDGMLTGPNADVMTEIAEETDLSIIASGGVGNIEDCEKIFNASVRGIEGIITGRALYENKLDLKTAIEKFQTEET
jgi:phosphoribosylformimino-5-aminoimidazole carboxamide ribotide isomerase